MGSVVTGLVSVAGQFLHLLREVNGGLGLSAVVMIAYVLVARRGVGATLGEGLFTVITGQRSGSARAAGHGLQPTSRQIVSRPTRSLRTPSTADVSALRSALH